MTLATSNAQLYLAMRSYWGPQGSTQRTLLNTRSVDSLTAQAAGSTNISIPANTTGSAVNFATYFPAMVLPLFVYIVDVTQPGVGFKYYFHSGSAANEKQITGPNGYFAWIGDGATAPSTVYIDNATAGVLDLEIGIASN